jgi:hypothetical protein
LPHPANPDNLRLSYVLEADWLASRLAETRERFS